MPHIFISYRRADSKASTGRIYDRLVAAFGKKAVFKDVDNIPPGQDFRKVLHAATAKCQVMLIVIGPGWVSATDERGNRRLTDPNDFARIEVETGLERDHLTVIPLLVDDAPMPNADEMPEALRELAYKNAFIIHDDPLFHHDMDTLIQTLRGIMRRDRGFLRWIMLAAAALMVVIIGAVTLPPLLGQPAPTQIVEVVLTRTAEDIGTQVAATTTPSSSPTSARSVTPKPSRTAIPKQISKPTVTPTPIRCLGALPSRLYKGATARVVVGGTPNRVRSAPGISEPQVGSLQPGAIFQVTDGPVCADGYVWYQVDGGGWTAESANPDYWIELFTATATPTNG